MKFIFLILLINLTSCSDLIKNVKNSDLDKMTPDSKFSVLFSHNISGETHPCGCRNFPLGGLPQVAGLFNKIKKQNEFIYVDTGDTFFPSSVIPQTMKSSLSFAAINLADGLDRLGLTYFVPGDQDFALGLDFLSQIANSHKFNFLISNLIDENSIKHVKIGIKSIGGTKLFFIGLVDPEVINNSNSALFKNVDTAIKDLEIDLKNAGYDANNSAHRLILLSHSGIDTDERLASQFPNIDWIIGSHSQSFLRFSKDVGNTKIVQTLSKNHYLGEIGFIINKSKSKDNYFLHEIREELQKEISPNPFIEFIENHKTKMNELQISEQGKTAPLSANKIIKYKTASACINCHQSQASFWQSTPHSIAYASLMNTREQNNLQCIKCHSLGLNDVKGFSNAKELVHFKDRPIIDYWNQAHALSSEVKSIRKLNPKEIKSISKKWLELDRKTKVKHNFANVQCLNCHGIQNNHPFSSDSNLSVIDKRENIKNRCLSCHTSDQSPEWYQANHKKINEQVFSIKFKKLSCPNLN